MTAERFVRGCAPVAGAFAIGIGVLTQLLPGSPRIPPSTAVMCVLAGVALWLVAREPIARRSRQVARICALAVCTISGLTGLEYVSDVELGLELLLPDVAGPWSGRPAPLATLAFLLLGCALLAIDRSIRGRRPADYLALAALLVATAALLGYLFKISVMYEIVPHAGMSFPAMLAVFALGFGILAARVERSVIAVVLARDGGGVAARRLLGGLLVLPPVVVVLLVGAHERWYSFSFASVLVLLVAVTQVSGQILSTAKELSRADGALHASEARVRVLVDQASDAIFIADLEGRYTDVNDAACRMLGYARAELLGKTIVDLIPQQDLPRLAAAKEQLLAGVVQISEWNLRHRDGTYVAAEVSAKIFADGRWQGIVRDITERKRAAAALARAAEAERELRAELEALMGAVSGTVAVLPRLDVDAVLRAMAEQARTLTGARYAAVAIGTAPDRVFDRWGTAGMPDDVAAAVGRPPRVVGVLGHVVATGEGIRVPDVTRHPAFRGLPAGHPALGSFLAAPIKHGARLVGTLYLANEHGGPEFSEHDERAITALADRLGGAIETATRYATESCLRAWLQSIIDQLPQGVLVLDEHGEVKAMNRALLALARPEAKTTDPWRNPPQLDIRDREQRPVPFDELPAVRALRSGEPIREQELLLCQADGRMLPIEASAGPVRDELQRITGAIAVVTDLSERKELERLREEWIAVVAHDLRQPINSIVLWSDRLASLASNERQRAAIERIRQSGWRLNRMIYDLLDAARIAAHRLSIEPRAVDLIELARTAIESAQLASPSADLRLIAPERVPVWADGDRVQQVLGNLISNAVKYGTPGAPIRIEITSHDAEVELAVINEGPEIPPDELRRLFARFARTQLARSADVPGIGLGLYICKGLIEAHGGRIWAESQHGTVAFRLTLPWPPE